MFTPISTASTAPGPAATVSGNSTSTAGRLLITLANTAAIAARISNAASPVVWGMHRTPRPRWLGGPWNRLRPQNKVDYGPAGCDSDRLPCSPNDDEAMNLTDDELTDLTAELTGGADTHRQPITDVNAWLDGLDRGTRPALRALGELLVGVAERDSTTRPESAERFTARCLGVAHCGHLLDEERDLNPVSRFTFALALAEWIEQHTHVCEIGPGDYTNPPKWTQTEIGGQRYRHPLSLRVHFPAGTLLEDTGCVIGIEGRQSVMQSAGVSAYVTPEHQDRARAALDRLAERANALNPYRGACVNRFPARAKITGLSIGWATHRDRRRPIRWSRRRGENLEKGVRVIETHLKFFDLQARRLQLRSPCW